MRKTKLVGTCGPASEDKAILRQLILSGVNVVRNNYSHGDHQEHIHRFHLVHELNKELGTYVGTLMDTKGPEIRTHNFKEGKAYIKQGSTVTVHMTEILGDIRLGLWAFLSALGPCYKSCYFLAISGVGTPGVESR